MKGNMSKQVTLNEHVRAIVVEILGQQKQLTKRWGQKEHGVATAKAAQAWAVEYDEATPQEKESLTWQAFLRRYGEHGFAGGNISQFQQALDALPAGDPCHVTRPKRGVNTEEYS
jgi:hypothetical protein